MLVLKCITVQMLYCPIDFLTDCYSVEGDTETNF